MDKNVKDWVNDLDGFYKDTQSLYEDIRRLRQSNLSPVLLAQEIDKIKIDSSHIKRLVANYPCKNDLQGGKEDYHLGMLKDMEFTFAAPFSNGIQNLGIAISKFLSDFERKMLPFFLKLPVVMLRLDTPVFIRNKISALKKYYLECVDNMRLDNFSYQPHTSHGILFLIHELFAVQQKLIIESVTSSEINDIIFEHTRERYTNTDGCVGGDGGGGDSEAGAVAAAAAQNRAYLEDCGNKSGLFYAKLFAKNPVRLEWDPEKHIDNFKSFFLVTRQPLICFCYFLRKHPLSTVFVFEDFFPPDFFLTNDSAHELAYFIKDTIEHYEHPPGLDYYSLVLTLNQIPRLLMPPQSFILVVGLVINSKDSIESTADVSSADAVTKIIADWAPFLANIWLDRKKINNIFSCQRRLLKENQD